MLDEELTANRLHSTLTVKKAPCSRIRSIRTVDPSSATIIRSEGEIKIRPVGRSFPIINSSEMAIPMLPLLDAETRVTYRNV